MARNQTFSVSLNLLTRQFNKGVKAVQNSLRSLRAQFQTFIGGIGVGLGFQELIDNAKSLDKVQTTLRNVSGTYEQFGENQKFIMELSKKYNQDLITLTGNFAKFYSAASYAGFALEEQQHIYESLTRASAYFNLTADETNGVMLAVQQMISKGRVSSEELRRQLGERLPGAMNLAAKAMGVSTGRLEEMIKSGEVLATDLLPKLVNELNGLTQNFDVNTIQGATNKLKNSFTELVQKLRVGDIYKGFLNGVSGGLDYISENLKSVAETIAMVLGSLFLKGGLEKGYNGWNKFFKDIEKKLDTSKAKSKVLKAELLEMSKTEGIRVKRAGGPDGRLYVSGIQKEGVDTEKLKEAQKLAQAHNNELRTQATLQDQLNHKIGAMGGKIKANLKSFGKMAGLQALYYGIAIAISTIITKVVKWASEQKRIRNLVKDTNAEFEKLSNKVGVDEGDLTATRDKYLSKDKEGKYIEDEKTRALLLARINKLLGFTGDAELKISDSEEKINKAIEDRLALYKKEREYQAARQTLTSAQNQKTDLEGKRAAAQGNVDNYTKLLNEESHSKVPNSDLIQYYSRQINKYTKEVKNIDKEIAQLNTVINDFSSKVADLGLGADERQKVLENTNPEPITDPDLQEEYGKIQKEHNNKLRALNEQLADEVITKEDYDKALKDLYTSTLESIYALDNVNENTDAFAKSILDRVKGFEESEAVQDKANETLKEYYTKTLELANQLDDGLITYEEYQDALIDLKEETLKNLSAMGELSDAAEELANTYRQQKADRAKREIGELEAPEMETLDTTLNYKKENSDIYQENADFIKDYADQLDDYIEKLKEYQKELSGADLENLNNHIDTLETNLEQLTMNAESFAQAAKFAEVQEDIANMKAELAQGIWDNITGIAQAAERLTNSFKSLQETWDDPDASGWEKFITTFTTIISVIETIVSVIQTFNTAMKVAEGLSLAMAAAEQAQIPVKTQELLLTKAQAAAAKELAIAKGMQSAASVPYPANLVAIASTSAALAAAFAAIPKFAKGGIVEGNLTQGDRNLVRANAGEMILTKGQQGTLWNMLNGKGSSGVGNVEFKIRGADLVGTINNYSKKISK